MTLEDYAFWLMLLAIVGAWLSTEIPRGRPFNVSHPNETRLLFGLVMALVMILIRRDAGAEAQAEIDALRCAIEELSARLDALGG